MGVKRFRDGEWQGLEVLTYKEKSERWAGVTRVDLAQPDGAAFAVRYFEVAPGGFTSLEKHEHVHLVVVIRGVGEVQIGEETTTITAFDLVEIGANQPHQFRNPGSESLGFLCVVDAQRDRPILLDSDTLEPLDRLNQSSCEI